MSLAAQAQLLGSMELTLSTVGCDNLMEVENTQKSPGPCGRGTKHPPAG